MGSRRLAVAAVAAALVCAASPAQAVVAPVQTGAARAPAAFGGSSGFGGAVAVSGDTVVVGAPFATVDGVASGAVVVYHRTADGRLVEQARLAMTDPLAGDLFGHAVAIAGDTIVVGAPGLIPQSDGVFSGKAAAYVFTRPAGGWRSMTQTAKLTHSGARASYGVFGWDVAVAGDAIAVSALDPLGTGVVGEADVFVKPARGWRNATQTARLVPAAAAANDGVGVAIAFDGSTLVLGGYYTPHGGTYRGAAYVFTRPASGWRDVVGGFDLPVSSRPDYGLFGTSLAVRGAVIAVGGMASSRAAGSVTVYHRPRGGWRALRRETARITAPRAANGLFFGRSVALTRGALAVGAPQFEGSAPGKVLVYGHGARGWQSPTAPHAITGGRSFNGDRFGVAVAMQGPWLVVGADGVGAKAGERPRTYLFRAGAPRPAPSVTG